ncbi:MAG: hypothetical protein IT385_12165 [Deltaproteobacteria bacterium]|nr:hypothetical protein [Deltaproteobacteria bacterium]
MGWTPWVAARAVALVAYAAVVLGAVGAEPRAVVAVVAIGLGVIAGVMSARGVDVLRARGALSAGALVLAALHARLLPADAPWLGLGLALAAGVAGSAATTLLAERAARLGVGRGIVTCGVTLAVGLVVVAPAVVVHGERLVAPAIVMLGLGALRPLSALAEVVAAAGLRRAPRDPMLWWRPLVDHPPREREVSR